MSYNYKDLVVKSCSGLNDEEKQWLRDLGPLDRFRLIIDDTTEGTEIAENAFSLYTKYIEVDI